MANKGDIGWKRRNEDGDKIQVSARKVGNRWLFVSAPKAIHGGTTKTRSWSTGQNCSIQYGAAFIAISFPRLKKAV